MRFTLRAAILAALLPYCLSAQSISRLTDLNPGSAHTFPEGIIAGDPVRMFAAGDLLFFSADDGVHGRELWVSDGTIDGTRLLIDINPGASGSNPAYFTLYDEKVYFSANDGTYGAELWVSDGTEAGTFMLKDLFAGGSSNPGLLTVAGNLLFFSARISNNQFTLWQTDGTETGTVTTPGLSFMGADPGDLTAMNNLLYFSGPDAELWATDGTMDGSLRVKEITPPGYGSPNIDRMVALGGKLYFSADGETANSEPWVSDGTGPGTFRLADISPGPSASEPSKFHLFKGYVYFSGLGELWRTDGTLIGTTYFKNLKVFQASNDPATFLSDDQYLYFPADDGFNGRELWRSDGTPAGTQLVKNINSSFFSSNPQDFTWGNDGRFWFRACDNNKGCELWVSDGTTAGTTLAADIRSGSDGSNPQALLYANNALYFVADDGVHGRELWKVDLSSTAANMPEVLDFNLTPNPADEHVLIDASTIPAPFETLLFNQAGQVVYATHQSDQSRLVIPTQHLPAGIYRLALIGSAGVGHRHLVVTH